ncbi:MAG TPA: hypothetical protein VFV99_03915, partial [Kofleriaceae bacterium]|nr:hypothetical protein [Kofleriaceae bacterium]
CLQRRIGSVMAGAVRLELAFVSNNSETVTRMLLDFQLEDVVRGRRGAHADDVALGYRKLTMSSDPSVRAAAHARLAQLARVTKHSANAATETEACIREVRSSLVADGWGRICERERAALKLPPLDPLRERLAAPTASTDIAIEPPL